MEGPIMNEIVLVKNLSISDIDYLKNEFKKYANTNEGLDDLKSLDTWGTFELPSTGLVDYHFDFDEVFALELFPCNEFEIQELDDFSSKVHVKPDYKDSIVLRHNLVKRLLPQEILDYAKETHELYSRFLWLKGDDPDFDECYRDTFDDFHEWVTEFGEEERRVS